MTAGSARKANCAKNDTAKPCSERRKGLRLNSQVMHVSRGLFPLKTSQHLAEITGYSIRSCEYWLSEKSVLPADALAALVQSDWGREYLAAVMAQTTPRWWLTFKALLKRISLEAAQAREEKLYREMLDEEAEARRGRPAAPRYQDDPFYEGQPAPVRALAKGRMK